MIRTHDCFFVSINAVYRDVEFDAHSYLCYLLGWRMPRITLPWRLP